MSVTPSNPKPISPLRARMIEDMTVRNFVAGTQREYIRAVKKLTAFIDRSPDTATAEELRAFQLHLTKTGATPPTINATVTALRFFFRVTLDRPETTRHLVFVHEPRKLPRVLPKGFHRIRHYGLLTNGARTENLATLRALLAMAAPVKPVRPPWVCRPASIPVAAAACSLSRLSREAAGGGGRLRNRPGSIRHEQQRRRFHSNCCPPSPPLTGRPRRRSLSRG